MSDNMITWNIRNWITVFLMFLAGWALVSLGIRFVKGPPAGGVGSDNGAAQVQTFPNQSRVGGYANG